MEYNQSQPTVGAALLAGNLPLMKIRLAEEYSQAFEKYEKLLKRRRQILAEESQRESEDSELLLRAMNEQVDAQATELRIQEITAQSAIAYFNKFFGDQE